MEHHSSVPHKNFEFNPYNSEICIKFSFVWLYTEVQSNFSTTILGLVSGALLRLKGGQDNAATPYSLNSPGIASQ